MTDTMNQLHEQYEADSKGADSFHEFVNIHLAQKDTELAALRLEAERLKAALKTKQDALVAIEDWASRAALVQDRSVHIIKQTCNEIAKRAKAALLAPSEPAPAQAEPVTPELSEYAQKQVARTQPSGLQGRK